MCASIAGMLKTRSLTSKASRSRPSFRYLKIDLSPAAACPKTLNQGSYRTSSQQLLCLPCTQHSLICRCFAIEQPGAWGRDSQAQLQYCLQAMALSTVPTGKQACEVTHTQQQQFQTPTEGLMRGLGDETTCYWHTMQGSKLHAL